MCRSALESPRKVVIFEPYPSVVDPNDSQMLAFNPRVCIICIWRGVGVDMGKEHYFLPFPYSWRITDIKAQIKNYVPCVVTYNSITPYANQ